MKLKRISSLSGPAGDLRVFQTNTPWLYAIIVHRANAVYIGETFAKKAGGLMYRLSNHLSDAKESSTLLNRLYEFEAWFSVPLPVSIIGIMLKKKDFDLKLSREACETLLNEKITSSNMNLTPISNTKSNSYILTKEVKAISSAIMEVLEVTHKYTEFGKYDEDPIEPGLHPENPIERGLHPEKFNIDLYQY